MKKYSFNKNLIFQKNKDSLILFNSEKSMIFHLNESASYILKAIKAHKQLEIVIEQFAKHFQVSKSKAEKDVIRCLASLMKKKIVVLDEK